MKFFLSWFAMGIGVVAVLLYGINSAPVKEKSEGLTSLEKLEMWEVASPVFLPLADKQEGAENENIQSDQEENTSSPESELIIDVYNSKADAYMKMPLEEYLYGVVLAEMPQSFDDEALKAQAVAARTMVLFKAAEGTNSTHPHAAVCTNSGHCMAYLHPEDYIAASAGTGSEFLERIKAAVNETKGEILTVDGEPIMAVFHASSYGRTENSEAMWSVKYPYLRAVESPEKLYPDKVKGLLTDKTVSIYEFYDKVCAKFPDTTLTVAAVKSGINIEKTDAGRVKTVTIGDTAIKGKDFRSMLGLRTTDFSVKYEDGNIIINVRGNGHGVGMSQYGASLLASEKGYSYKEILTHYYTGVEITNCLA